MYVYVHVCTFPKMCKASISKTTTKNFAELSRFTTNLKDQINETITKLFQNRRELPVMMKARSQ